MPWEQGNGAVSKISAGTGITVAPSGGTGDVTVTNSGVTKISAGTAMTITPSGGTGEVTVTNNGVTSLSSVANSGITVSASTGAVAVGYSPPVHGFFAYLTADTSLNPGTFLETNNWNSGPGGPSPIGDPTTGAWNDGNFAIGDYIIPVAGYYQISAGVSTFATDVIFSICKRPEFGSYAPLAAKVTGEVITIVAYCFQGDRIVIGTDHDTGVQFLQAADSAATLPSQIPGTFFSAWLLQRFP